MVYTQGMNTFLLLIWLHFLSDFILQTSWMALNKSKFFIPLFAHVFVYWIPFTCFFGFRYGAVNLLAHFLTDFITARIAVKLAKREDKRYFFMVIGLDQAIHLSTLLLTLPLARL